MLGCRRGIAHSELSINNRTDLHGVQLWTALPEHSRNIEPSFDHYADLPVFEWNEMGVRLFIGGFLGNSSPAKSFSPIVGAEIDLPAGSSTDLPAIGSFEYGVLVVSGQTSVNGHSVNLGQLHYIPAGNQTLLLASPNGAKLILLGGEPFEEKIVMWWNFIGRSHAEILEMRDDWENQHSRFEAFPDRIGGRIPAPPLPNLKLKPRGNPSSE